MKTIEINLYSFDELNEQAKENAINNYRNSYQDHSHYYGDIINSAKAAAKVFNLSFGNRYNHLIWDNYDTNVLELSGIRLRTWLINNHYHDLYKGKYYGKLVKTHKDGTPIQVSKEHPAGLRHVRRYSKVFFDNDCVLTGVCYDHDILEPVYKFIEKPDNSDLDDLFREMEYAIHKTFNDAEEWLNSDEYIIDYFEANEIEFTEDGTIY